MQIFAVCGIFCCFTQIAGLHAAETAESVIAKSHFTGGVVVHVGGADASLLQSIEKQCPNMLV